ncbi:helix-turn-helix transcriptional regulator [Candidatus Gribaldobacteria bacterium]|nr:helix-turn-helix transcriptional regulator [Candidatus Gribaldobacteria bacterium]
MQTLKSFKKQLLKDKATKVAYDNLEAEFALFKSLIKARLNKGISQKELAQKIGTHQSAISRFEVGNYNPSLNFLQKIARALNLNMKILFTER